MVERAMGIEPTAQAWEAWVLPLYDARLAAILDAFPRRKQISGKERRPAAPFSSSQARLSDLVELVVRGNLHIASENPRKVRRGRRRVVAAGRGERRERRLLVEHVVDYEANLELRVKFHTERGIDEPPRAHGQNILR